MMERTAVLKRPENRQLEKAASYAEWVSLARERDRIAGKLAWRTKDESQFFDYRSIRARLEHLHRLRESGDDHGLLFTLNEGIHGNMDGMANEHLWGEALSGTKFLITAYVEAIADALVHLARPEVNSISAAEKRDFFERALHCYGCSSLLLSGSGAFLYFHIGVVRAMVEQRLLPDIIAGSSGGALVGAVVCTHTESELETLLSSHEFDRLSELGKQMAGRKPSGTKPQTQDDIAATLAALIPDITFQEAFALTGRHLNVSVAPAEKHQNGRMLNAITSPNVYIRDAVLASCAVPGIFAPVQLMAKDATLARVAYLPERRWVDGSVTHDLPTKRLSRLYGVNHHIVSQANPLAMPFATETKQVTSPLQVLQQAATTTAKALFNAQVALLDRPLAVFPQLHRMMTIAQSVINQEYSGDINIIRPVVLWTPTKLLSQPSVTEMDDLIDLGERIAWPKLEMIRVQTLISRTLTAILRDLEPTGSIDALSSARKGPQK
jgi:TAG lipase / steryl ester hydrolase / phospholipase A2 / LPA acyltransferase